MKTISDKQAARQSLAAFVQDDPARRKEQWTVKGGGLLASERLARLEQLRERTPRYVIDLCQKIECDLETLIDAHAELDRTEFYRTFYGDELK